jgi:hypothetical protein
MILSHRPRYTTTRNYGKVEAWGFDSQTYAPPMDLLAHASTFVEHKTGLAWTVCLSKKNADSMIDAVKALQNHIITEVGAALQYLWTDSDPAALPKAFTEYQKSEAVNFGVSPPY